MDKAARYTAETFIRSLTGADAAEVLEHISEIESNREFHRRLRENRSGGRGARRSFWSIGPTLGAVLYALCRKQQPGVVVETGVASGMSSSYILCALEASGHGRLCSVDLPWTETQSGWAIPDYLRHRWKLTTGRASEKLDPLLDELGEIDIFLHDSDHSYGNMTWEFQAAWAHLKVGGLLLSHNIDSNDAFPDFCRNVAAKACSLYNMGGLAKG